MYMSVYVHIYMSKLKNSYLATSNVHSGSKKNVLPSKGLWCNEITLLTLYQQLFKI